MKRKKLAALLAALVLTAGSCFVLPAAAAEETPNADLQPAFAPVVTGYTVMNAEGQELQRISAGEPCVIVVSIRDTAFNSENKAQAVYDARGNIGNAKVTSTGSFSPPALENIRFTAPQFDATGVSYAVVFDGITYLGGENQLAFDLTYNDLKHPLTNLSVGISQCVAPAAAEVRPSALVVQTAGYGGGPVAAGTAFELTAEILATAGNTPVDLMQVVLELPEGITAAAGSSCYLGQMAPESSRQVSFQLTPQPAAEPGSYNITVSVSGVAQDGSAVGGSLQLAVPVTQPERFEITALEADTAIQEGQEGMASVTFVNKGKATLYNLSARIEGENLKNPGQDQYLGNLAAGTEQIVDFSLQPSEAGVIEGKVVLTWEDETGAEKSLEQAFTVEVIPSELLQIGMPQEEQLAPETIEDGSGMPLWGWLLIYAALIGAVAAVRLVRRRRAEELLRAAEGDEDEPL